MKTRKLIRGIYKKYPKYLQEGYDHVGRQIGKTPEETHKVLVCLDYDSSLNEIVREFKPDLIITHHPFIFGTRYRVLQDEYKLETTRFIEEEMKTCIYSFHTNFDNSKEGMNYLLSHKLGLKDIYQSSLSPALFIGYLDQEMDVKEYSKIVKERLDVSYIEAILEGKSKIKKVGIIGGAASSYYRFGLEEDLDLYISGDCPHHLRREMIERKVNYFDIPHEVEKIFIEGIEKDLLEMDSSLIIKKIYHEKEPLIL